MKTLIFVIAICLLIAFAANGCWSNLFVDLKSETSFDYSIKAYGTFSCREGGCACPDVTLATMAN